MGAVSEWAGSILSFLILITVIRGILPSKKYEPYLRLFSGLMLILLSYSPSQGGLAWRGRSTGRLRHLPSRWIMRS